MAEHPGIGQWLQFKAKLVERMLAGFRKVMDDSGGEHMELMPNAFPPPFTAVSGMDFAAAAEHSAAISVKLYTMHWPMILRFYGDQILNANPGLSSQALVRALQEVRASQRLPLPCPEPGSSWRLFREANALQDGFVARIPLQSVIVNREVLELMQQGFALLDGLV